jgi:hypothetical protein
VFHESFQSSAATDGLSETSTFLLHACEFGREFVLREGNPAPA